jgi:nucleoside-diphosphate-sugar epimerase
MARTVAITGSSGYLGSALCADLARDHRIVGIDRRPPSPALRKAAPRAAWENIDISGAAAVSSAFQRIARSSGGIDFVIHFAVYYHYGRGWRQEYGLHNIQGTRNIIEAACRAGAGRFIFAASIAALQPPPPGEALTEGAGDMAGFPYCRSTAAGERLCAERLDELPAVVMRIGGVFSDWCEAAAALQSDPPVEPPRACRALHSRAGAHGLSLYPPGRTGPFRPARHRKKRRAGPPRGVVCLGRRLHRP